MASEEPECTYVYGTEVVYLFPPRLRLEKCLLGLGFEQYLSWTLLELIRSTVCSQELGLSVELLGFFNQQLWKLFAWITTKLNNIFVPNLSKKVSDLKCGQDETLLWLKPTFLQPYKQQSKMRLFEFSWTAGSCDQQSPSESLSEQANSQICCTRRIAKQWLILGWYSHSLRVSPLPA